MGAHGQGTRVPIQTRRKDGSIRRRIRVVVTMADGRRVWRTVRDDREADRVQARLVEARELELDPTQQTLADFLRSWVSAQRETKRRRIRERTLRGYEAIVEQRIIPELGKVKLASLTRRKIQAWADAQPGSAQTVRNAHAVLRKALASATGDSIPTNPAVGVELAEREGFRGKPLTAAEARRLLEATAGDRLYALWRLALVTGLRAGELLGLPRDALDGDTLRVTAQLQRIGGRWVLGPTKVARRLEWIELDAATVAVVRTHLKRMADERQPSWRFHGLMFVTPAGEPYHLSTLLAEFRRACAAAGVTPRRVHDLRHTANRLLKDAGVDQEVRKARLGHASDEMTERYGGPSQVRDRVAAEAMAEAIGG